MDMMQIYQHAFEKTDALVYLLGQDGLPLACNYNLLKFLGFEKIEQNSIYSMMQQQGLWTSQQIQTIKQKDLEILASGKKKLDEQTLIRDNGAILFFEISRIPLLDASGSPLGLMVTLRDITNQKQLDEQLKDMKMQLRFANKFIGNTDEADAEVTAQVKAIKVLLVEDNLLTQKAEKSVLMSCRCLADAVATPEQVCEIFKPGKYNLILMDIGLEKGNGYQITAALRKSEEGSGFRVPIIALTASDLTMVGLDCEDAEMDGIMHKPLTAEKANQLIQRYIRHANINVKGLNVFKH